MKILGDVCVGCGECIIFCPLKAIEINDAIAVIDTDKCVECFNCVRNGCPVDAIQPEELAWPRKLAESLSNPIGVDEKSGVSGRGTAEMKTNEVTGRIGHGKVGICLELGRPGVGTTFYDVEKICKALAAHEVFFEPLNPVTYVMKDTKTGELRDDVRSLYVLSAIVEGLTDASRLEEVLKSCQKVAEEIDTVFSIGLSSLVKIDGSTYFDEVVAKMKLPVSSGAKTNVGLGKPAYDFTKGAR